ncbi:redoxin family protein [Bradyrhizobium sp. CCGUVB4N]|uniref:redoxin family protein n=1 Tax=Bradyrhizobium sp. CCGUVB4N TaxID=2949631 RepID=UPI0020B2717F|nr:redoxin family protein [Bradyrhizobium sp. CCGUVB4N]MCP3381274.1 redoxin family protein [Bradyrhizobium sp. CCGUVB4N]
MASAEPAKEWQTTEWFNTPEPLSLAALRGRIVMLTAFQMLCPGCVANSLPQAQRVAAMFKSSDVAVIGLHSVFEHHDAMGPNALRVFLHEYQIRFPVAVDAPDGTDFPRTMRSYGFQGTPTMLLFDRDGQLRRHVFGHIQDLQLGAEIMALVCEGLPPDTTLESGQDGVCATGGCHA